MIYLDNAATSFPKPQCVMTAMADFIQRTAANPGRSGHRLSIAAGRIVDAARTGLADFFNVADPLRIVFTANVTGALNLALYGCLHAGDHVITTAMEHNAMMRPLRDLERRGVGLTIVPCSSEGCLDPSDVQAAMTSATVMIAVNHASNVVGTVLPVRALGAIARDHDCLVFVEVRTRTGLDFGHPEESITRTKKDRLRQVALHYLQSHDDSPVLWRIDVVCIELDHRLKPKRIELIEDAVWEE